MQVVEGSGWVAPLELQTRSGHRVHVPVGFDGGHLRHLLEVLAHMLRFPAPPWVRIFVGRRPVELRKECDRLSGEEIEVIDEDPLSSHLFVSGNCRRDRMKALVWDGSGFWLLD